MSHTPHNPLAHPVEPHEPQPSALEAFLDKHFKSIIWICAAAVLASGAWQFIKYRTHVAAEEAANAATAAKTVEDCDIVVQKYKGSVAAGNALLTKAKLLWEQNKKDTAVAALREFVANYGDHPFKVQGLIALASRLESLGGKDVAEAKTLFEKVVNEHKDSESAGLAQLRLADILWSEGKEAEAKAIYDEMPRKFIGQFADRVTERTEWLAASLPTKEVDAPKVPDALKAPSTPATPAGTAPAINLTPGKNGSPIGLSQPFEVKAQPSGKPAVKVNAAPATPGAAPIKIEPKPATPPPAPNATTPAAPAPATSAPATATPAATAPPAPAPAAPPASAPKPAPAPAPDAAKPATPGAK